MENVNIKPIDRTSVHKICSGQAVLTLATAIKELVENSIDAGSTMIDINLKDYGKASVEVSDNGRGVMSDDFQNLTLKHHTSKIADFTDLPFVSTYGFRGEALSSLCALCDLEITTRHEKSEVAFHLQYDNNGILTKNSYTHRQIGTTVLLKNLFRTLPVRQKEFQQHIKREYQKAIHLLTAYCLISVNITITCNNVTEKGKKNCVLSTKCCHSYKDNILSLFGDKQIKHIMEIDQKIPSKDILNEYLLPDSIIDCCKKFKLEGYVSSSNHGNGRSSSDRQFFSVNGRPCDMQKVSKTINEVYHSFNKHQYPFIFMNIIVLEGYSDVNVTPDKRKIFILEEKILLAVIKATLLEMYQLQPAQMTLSVLKLKPINTHEGSSFDKSEQSSAFNFEKSEFTLKRKLGAKYADGVEESQDQRHKTCKIEEEKSLICENNNFEDQNINNATESNVRNRLENESLNLQNIKQPTLNHVVTQSVNEEIHFRKANRHTKVKNEMSNSGTEKKVVSNDCKPVITSIFNKTVCIKNNYTDKYISINSNSDFGSNVFNECSANESRSSHENYSVSSNIKSKKNLHIGRDFDEPLNRKRNYEMLPFSMDVLLDSKITGNNVITQPSCGYRKFRSKIMPTDNTNAEEELKKEIRKEHFSQMKIIGQFNLGFIITQLNNDLFIIDQHATDEKYNFELLQKNYTLENQKLLQPQTLELAPSSEAVLLDNLRVFELNGFKFKIEAEDDSRKSIQLICAPINQNCSLGKVDVDELIFMLADNPSRVVRPSKVNQMFAMKACRKSVMIGTALSRSTMEKLVLHMGELDQPWNCPHGRPTMRHLFNLDVLTE